jgi:hypothetical protein
MRYRISISTSFSPPEIVVSFAQAGAAVASIEDLVTAFGVPTLILW